MVLSVVFAVNPPTDAAQSREWAVQANSAGYRARNPALGR